MVDIPTFVAYASLVSIEVNEANVQNAFLTDPNTEEYRTTGSPKFGFDAGKKVNIVRAHYDKKGCGNLIESIVRTA